MSHVETYLFPRGQRHISKHIVLGVSLGGHAAWLSLFHEPRVTAGIVVIGCCDFATLMHGRARLSARPSFSEVDPTGLFFIGSSDFPAALRQAVLQIDPASILLGDYKLRCRDGADLSTTRQRRLRELILKTIGQKRILNLAGGSDKFVPHSASQDFLKFLTCATQPGGFAEDTGVSINQQVLPGVGHEVNQEMHSIIHNFIIDCVSAESADIKAHL